MVKDDDEEGGNGRDEYGCQDSGVGEGGDEHGGGKVG